LAELAKKIDDKELQEDLLSRAIEQIKQTEDRNQRSVLAIWLTEKAEILMKLGRGNDAKACIAESERVIKQNLF
jgi:dsDNA-binding SOS-regulon protein